MSVSIDWPIESGGILSTTKFVQVNAWYKVEDGTKASIGLVYSDNFEIVPGSYESKPPNTLEGKDYIQGSTFSSSKCSFKVKCAVHSVQHANSMFRFRVTTNGVHIHSDSFKTVSKLSRKNTSESSRNVSLRSDTENATVVSGALSDGFTLPLEELSERLFSDAESLASTNYDDNSMLMTLIQLVAEVTSLRKELEEIRKLLNK
tara:strand:- start:2033 stop:2644 length:612 start_codon:yes stop_codon:yes gene_type:complete